MDNQQLVMSMVEKARVALAEFEKYTQEQVDECIKAMLLAFGEHAEELARETVEETRLGDLAAKIEKNAGSPDNIWYALKGKKSVGIIGYDEKEHLAFVAKPKGIMCSVAPCTNPNVTAVFNAAYALKGRNVLIVAPHPRAKKTTLHTVEIMNEALAKLGAPANLLQCIEEPSIECTQILMQNSDVIIATGGAGMVKSAYSSGHPAFGVGPGNVQTIIGKGFDYKEAAKQIVQGRSYDNGLICAGNQSAIYPASDEAAFLAAMKEAGAYYVDDPATVEKLRTTLFPDGRHINSKVVGQYPKTIAELAGIEIPEGTRIILVKVDKANAGDKDPLCAEKMCPVTIAIAVDSFEEGVAVAKKNLEYEGAGHSAVVHTYDNKKAEYAGVELPVSRLLVNQPGIFAANPAMANGFNPTSTLGCGSWGNNSISENLTYEHLINISRIGWMKKPEEIPTHEQIWAE